MKKIIYFVIESDFRELESKIILSLNAAKKGMYPAIVKKSRLFEKLHLIRPGIIFLKSFGRNYDLHLDKIKSYNHIITGFDEEGLQIYHKNKLIGDRFSLNVLNSLNIIFSNGNYAKKIYEKHFNRKRKKIQIISSGNPRLDVLKQTTSKYFAKTKEKIKNKYGNFILIATQFPMYNLNTGDIIKNPDHFPMFDKNLLKTKLSITNKNKLKHFLHQKKNFLEYKKLYFFLNKKFAKTNFILKPHPVENHEYYKNMIKLNKFKNIKTIHSRENIIPYILACETMIAYNSTTSVESFMLNKTSINYIPFRDKLNEFKLTKLLSLNVSDMGLLEKILKSKKYKKKNSILKNKIKEAEKILNNLISRDSIKIIIDKLLSLKTNPFKLKDKRQNRLYFIYFFLKTKTINLFNHIFYSHRTAYKVQVGKRDKLNKLNIQIKVNEISKILYPKTKFIVKEKYYGIYYIEKL